MQKVNALRIVMASPGDVKAERDLVTYVAEELNAGIARDKGLRLDVWRWETDVSPGFHPEGPQGLVDPVLKIEESDVFIGIFWTRFGTPTKDANSGTEHEFRKAFAAWQKQGHPRIMFYFNTKPSAPKEKAEMQQWLKVIEFRQGFPFEGLYATYESDLEFERKVRKDLTSVIQNLSTPQALAESRQPQIPVDSQPAQKAEEAEKERVRREQERLTRERAELDGKAKLKVQQETNLAEAKPATPVLDRAEVIETFRRLAAFTAKPTSTSNAADTKGVENFQASLKKLPIAQPPPSANRQWGDLLNDATPVASPAGEQRLPLKGGLSPLHLWPALQKLSEANRHHAEGRKLAAERKWDQAIVEFREAIRLWPGLIEPHRDLGNALGWKGDWDGKAAEAREVIRLNPNDIEAHLQLGAALSWKGDWDGAAVCAQKALSLDPENPEAHFGLGMVFGQKLDWDGKVFRMREALRRKPGYPEAHRELGFALEWKRDWFGALNELREAIRLSPQDAAAHHGLAKAYYETGNREAALDEYRTAYLLDPQNANFRWSYEAMAQERNLPMQMPPVPRFFY